MVKEHRHPEHKQKQPVKNEDVARQGYRSQPHACENQDPQQQSPVGDQRKQQAHQQVVLEFDCESPEDRVEPIPPEENVEVSKVEKNLAYRNVVGRPAETRGARCQIAEGNNE